MDTSFIIVNWNTKKLTQQAINSIIDTCPSSLKFEVIMVDNNSSDGSVEHLQHSFAGNPNVIIHSLADNIGYGPAHNEGYKISKGEWIFFLNSDIIFLDNCIKNLLSAASKDKMAGLYSPRVLNEDLSDQDVYSFLMPYTYLLLGNMLSRKCINYSTISTGVIPFEMIHGVAYYLHRNFLEKYGVWSNDFIMYCEDWDFCFRIYKNKKKCLMVADAQLIHLSQSSSQNKWNNIDRNKLMEIGSNRFAKNYSDFGCYEFYWTYSLIKSIYYAYVKGIEWHKNLVRAKLWFLKVRLFDNIEKEEMKLIG